MRPSDEALAQIDEPAPDNTWHDAPNLSKDDLKKRTQGFYKKSKPAGASGGAAGDASTSDAQGAGELQDPASDVAKNKTSEYRDRAKSYLQSKMPQERRDQAIWRLKVSSWQASAVAGIVSMLLLTQYRK